MGSLPVALSGKGFEVTVLSPMYRPTSIKIKGGREIRLELAGEAIPAKVFTQEKRGVRWAFLDAPSLFNRPYVYNDSDGDVADEHRRFSALAFTAIEGVRQGLFEADVLHAHDWHTALVPYLLRRYPAYREDPALSNLRCLLTIHNLGYQGVFPKEVLDELGLPAEDFNTEVLEFYGKVNFIKAGIVFADAVNVVSPQYAREIQTPEAGFALDGLLRKYAAKLTGILDGIDSEVWNPRKDKALKKKLTLSLDRWKAASKAALQEEMGLEMDPKVVLVGIVSRLTPQKGIDVVCEAADRIVESGMQMAVLGRGSEALEKAVRETGGRLAGRFAVKVDFDDALARRIYAGSDLFLVPSRYEPCGLTQMIAMRYGAVPVAHRVGGLIDTIEEGRTGFLFSPLTADSVVDALGRAREACANGGLSMLRKTCTEQDFSWDHSAEAYAALLYSLKPA